MDIEHTLNEHYYCYYKLQECNNNQFEIEMKTDDGHEIHSVDIF